MKSLRPLNSFALAGLLGGVIIAIIAAIANPNSDTRTVRGLLIWFVAGAGSGLFMVAPIVAGEVFHRPLARFLGYRAFRVNWYVSLGMAMALGYLYSSMYHQTFDTLAAVSLVVVFLGALAKTLLGAVYERHSGDA
ncbi:MAG: hypothetical protein ACT4QC_00340 [Planctomycetaceae bacterium]